MKTGKNYSLDFEADKKELFKSCIKAIEKLGHEIEEINDDNFELNATTKKIAKIFGGFKNRDAYDLFITVKRSGSNKSTLTINVKAHTAVIDFGVGKSIAQEIFDKIS